VRKIFAAWSLASVLFAPSLAPIATDAFTDSPGTNLTAHTMSSGGLSWAEEGVCLFHVQSNKATWEASAGSCIASVESSDASVTVESDIAIPNAADYQYGHTLRFSDTSNYWVVSLNRSSSGTPQMFIYDITSGGYDGNCDTDNLGAVSGTTVTLLVIANGNTIDAYLDGSLVSTCTTASFNNTATKHGLFIYSASTDTSGTWDDFSIDSDTTAPGGGATINPAKINTPIRGGGRAFLKELLHVR
jgi:hypothetical protein